MHFRLASSSSGSVTVQVPQTPIGSVPSFEPGVTLQLYVAQRVGARSVELVFALDVKTNPEPSQETALQGAISANRSSPISSVSGVSLFVPSLMKEYLTYMARPTDDLSCLCSTVDPSAWETAPSTSYYTALVAAPPAGDNQVSFVTGLGTIAGVTLTGS